jgi:hypothetical protein
MKRWVIAVIIVTLLLVAAGFYLSSQPPPPQPTPQFRAAMTTSAFGTGATESQVESGGGVRHPRESIPEHGSEARVLITGDKRC